MERRNEFENIPKQIKAIIEFLMKNGPEVDGIFRIAAPSEFRDKWSKLMDTGEFLPLSGKNKEDLTHNVASVFKLYIRELPNPLLTHELYDEFIKTSRLEDPKERLECYSKLLTEIPNDFREMLKELLTLCNLIAAKSDSNRMTPINLAVVFGIGILRSKDDLRNVQDVSQIQKVYIDLMEMHPNHFLRAQQILDAEDDNDDEEEIEKNENKIKLLLKLKAEMENKQQVNESINVEVKQETKEESKEETILEPVIEVAPIVKEEIEIVQSDEMFHLLPNKHETDSHYFLWFSKVNGHNIKFEKGENNSIYGYLEQNQDIFKEINEIEELSGSIPSFKKSTNKAKFNFSSEISFEDSKVIEKEFLIGILITKKK
jgi:hypothetical protein